MHTKSILKHRTISEMLTTPGRSASPAVEVHPSVLEGAEGAQDVPKTVLIPVKSDTNLAARKKKNTGGSPPPSTRLLRQASSQKDEPNGVTTPEEKRHISFNTRVDQCIAIDYHEPQYDAYSDGVGGGAESDEEAEEESADSDSEDDDGEVLTMRSNRSTSPPSRAGSSSSHSSNSNDMPSIIAKLAPTRLKTTDVFPAPSPAVVDPSNFAAQYASGSARASSSSQAHGTYGSYDDEPRSTWEDDSGVDYFNAPFLDASSDGNGDEEDEDEDDDHFSFASTPGAGSKAKDRSAVNSTASQRSNAVDSSSVSSAGSSHSSAPTSAGTHEPAQPRSILKRRTGPPTYDAPPSEANGGGREHADTVAGVAGSSSFASDGAQVPGAHPSSHDSANDSDGDVSGRGRTSQRLGSSTSYERLQDASRRSAVGSSTSPATSEQGQRSTGPSSPPERERRGSFRGRDGDGQQRSGAAARLNLGSPSQSVSSDIEAYSASSGRPSVSDDDDGAESDSRSASSKPKRGGKGKGGSGGSMSPAGSQRLSVDLENLPSNDPAAAAGAPTSGGQGGPTPLNTPTLALARSRSKSLTNSDDGHEEAAGKAASDRASKETPSSPVMPRRTSATGALVAPSDADRQAGVRVPLADDFVEEDEGGIVGRAVEIVNTARDLIAAVWPRSSR